MLIVAGILEVTWAIGLKHTNGFTKLGPSIFTISTMIASLFILSQALKVIPVGTGYAVWTGIGAIGTVLVGMIFLGESRDPPRIICLGMILLGIVGLKLFSQE
jgi:quaternary ammonium compound-resistance protein SugE